MNKNTENKNENKQQENKNKQQENKKQAHAKELKHCTVTRRGRDGHC